VLKIHVLNWVSDSIILAVIKVVPAPDAESIEKMKFAGCIGVTVYVASADLAFKSDEKLLAIIFGVKEGDVMVTPSIPSGGISKSAEAIRICW
jgi:hypothetical protein